MIHVAISASAAVLKNEMISPELDPTSDRSFFKKDYPTDKRPVAGKHYVFGHPYPAVQDSGDFDRDFVKDENFDGGRWKAQMDYDTLRVKIREAEKQLDALREQLEEHDRNLKQATDRYKDSSKSEDEAEAARRKAESEASQADAKVRELQGKADGSPGGAIGDAVDDVNKEMSDLEECKRQLAEAKRKLKELLKEKDALEKKEKIAKEDAAKAAQKESDEAARKEAEEKKRRDEADKVREGEEKSVHDEIEARTRAEEEWKKRIAEEEKRYGLAVKSYEEELVDVRRTEAELERAAENLRKYRRPPHVDDDGGVYYKPESDAWLMHASPIWVFVISACIGMQ